MALRFRLCVRQGHVVSGSYLGVGGGSVAPTVCPTVFAMCKGASKWGNKTHSARGGHIVRFLHLSLTLFVIARVSNIILSVIMASKKVPGCTCCVVGCKNNSLNAPDTHFYVFPSAPHKKPQRDKWIKAVNRKSLDSSEWRPKKHTRICSQHFIGSNKSDHPLSPSFVPSIFPNSQNGKNEEKTFASAVRRFDRSLRRQIKSRSKQSSNPRAEGSGTQNFENEELSLSNKLSDHSTSLRTDQETQVDFLELSSTSFTFVYNHHASTKPYCSEAGVQVSIPLVISKQNYSSAGKEKKDSCCGTDIVQKDVCVGPDTVNKNLQVKCDSGFHGFSSITSNQELLDLAGVTFDTFNLLLKVLEQNRLNNPKILNDSRTPLRDQLLIFLLKMKCGITFSALSVLFKVHRTTASRIFFFLLRHLAHSCKNFVIWPSKKIVQSTMPTDFKENYGNCRVIIDCTEFRVEQPCTVEHRVHLYSQYKKGFTVKVLIGCTPGGYISFVSKCHGGRTTDAQITTGSEFLELLEPGDVVLADKGFPGVKTALDASGKGTLLVMPPFLHNNHFSAEEVAETYKIARHRIHIERIMQRIRIYKILDKLSLRMLPHCDDIVFMCCVLVNLQPPILKPSDDEETLQK
ncbi:uncharacterized protein [Venturia canescens]|uniref:uncharacterized protein n=1 Tax=Venturia canescens TaxID=32260 RepID=UPI001C9C06F9|nr:uncharacterized protein LOC122410255 [Venturia canescens]